MAEPDQSLNEDEVDQQKEYLQPEQAEEPAEEPEDAPVAPVASVATGGERWPGWPGESVFRILVPAQKVGSIIGRKGEYIKKMCEETKARIKILDGPPGITERAVMISAKEEPESSLPPAIDGLLRVHKRVVDGLDGDSSQAALSGVKVSTRLLVPAPQAGNVIGKQGATVKSIQEASNCIVRVIEDLPVFAFQDDRIVEVLGEPAAAHKALELIASHLRKFLVDRSIIPILETQMQKPVTHMEYAPPSQSWGPPPQPFPPSVTGPPPYRMNPPFFGGAPPRQNENYYPSVEMPPHLEKQPYQGMPVYNREAPLPMQSSASNPAVQSLITQLTQQMVIPLSFADAVIGTDGASISYIRRVSGATVTIQENREVPGEMTAEISGSASQVQTAQQLIQNCIADAAAAQNQAATTTDQGYGHGAYANQSSMYPTAPPNAGVGGQTGAYGSVYGGNYGY